MHPMEESAARVNTVDAMPKMTPGEFIGKWRASSLKERLGNRVPGGDNRSGRT